MSPETYYLAVNRTSLAHYFLRAIILPTKYYDKRPPDLQNGYNEYLLISKDRWIEGCNCSLELVFAESEKSMLINNQDGFFLFKSPLPISRVKKIWFLNDEQKKQTLVDINLGVGFIPEDLAKVEPSNKIEVKAPELKKLGFNHNVEKDETEKKITRFDKILGAFAFMKLGLSSDQNFSENYFSTLSYFNNLIESQLQKAITDKKTKLNTKYFGLFSINESGDWKDWYKDINRDLREDDIKAIAKNRDIKIKINLGKIDLNQISTTSHFYEIAVIGIYGDNKTRKTDELVSDLKNGKIAEEKKEDVAIVFGLNNGYTKLRNKYGETIVKFKLETQLDYYIIESVYQFVFNTKRDNSVFDYLDNWCPKSTQTPLNTEFNTFKILDAEVIAKKKTTAEQIFLEESCIFLLEELNKSAGILIFDETKTRHLIEKILVNPLVKYKKAIEGLIFQEFDEKNFDLRIKKSQKKEEIEFNIPSKLVENNAIYQNKTIEFEVLNEPKEIDNSGEININEGLFAGHTNSDQLSNTKNSNQYYGKMDMPQLKKYAIQMDVQFDKNIKKTDLKNLIKQKLQN